MPDAWRAYLEMALGLTEQPRKKAQQVAGDLVNRGGATAAQLQGLVEDLLQSGMANREALTNIVRYEVDRALGVVGLATADEVSELTTRVRDLEKQLREAQARATATLVPGSAPGTAAKKAVAKKAVAKKAAESPAAPAVPAPPLAPAKKAVAEKAVAKKAVAKKAVAKKAVAKAADPAADVLAESIGDDLTATQREALRAAVGETPGSTAAPARSAAKKTAAKKTAKSAPAKAAPVTPAKAAKVTPAKAAKVTPAKAAKVTPAKNAPAKNAPAKKTGPTKTAPTKTAPTTTPEA